MDWGFKESVAVVTGGNSGIGRSISLRLAEAGATVIMIARDAAKGESTRREIADTDHRPTCPSFQCHTTRRYSNGNPGPALYQGPGVAWITLNRPERLNAYTGEMMDAWYHALVDARDDDAVRAIVVTGAGRGFCSGIDLRDRAEREAQAEAKGHTLPTIAQQRSGLRNGSYRFHRLLAQMDKPYIAAVNGAAAGAGMDMASMCDIRIASDQARFTLAYINMAVVPDQGACYFLPRIVGIARALDLIWTGRLFNAQEALEMGYVSRVVPHDRLLDEVGEYARQLARQPAVAVQLSKQLLYRSLEGGLTAALDATQLAYLITRSTEDAIEGPKAFVEKRPPQFKGR